jgi:hypothetical protein
METQIETKSEPTALEKLERVCIRHLNKYNWPYDNRLVVEPAGSMRLAATIGWLIGLRMAGREELAESLATDLDAKLQQLSEWGGDVYLDEGETRRVPRNKIVLADDGLWGCFSVLWYRAIRHDQFMEQAKSHDTLDSYTTGDTEEWTCVLEMTDEALRCRNELSEFRHWNWNTKYKMNDNAETVRYGFQFNGGLILHGFGPTFSAEIGGKSGPHWSIHT